jgi:transposase
MLSDASDFAVKNDTHNDAHNDSSKADERYRRVELITGTTRHLRRSDEERARILAESFEPGANIAAVARKHGVNGGLLHYWRRRAKAQALETTTSQPPLFIPVTMANPGAAGFGEGVVGAVSSGSISHGRMIEIETSGARILVPEGVDAKTLSIVLAALGRAS